MTQSSFFGILIIVGIAVIVVDSYSNKCYKCASKHIQLNWGRYMPLQADSMRTFEIKGAKQCSSDSIPESSFNCNGPCMSINVTGSYDGKPAFFASPKEVRILEVHKVSGTLRDCYSHHFRTPKILMSDRECHVEQLNIKGNTYDAEYCYCIGDYCNGKQPIRASSRRALTSSSSPKGPPSFLILLLLFVICFFSQ